MSTVRETRHELFPKVVIQNALSELFSRLNRTPVLSRLPRRCSRARKTRFFQLPAFSLYRGKKKAMAVPTRRINNNEWMFHERWKLFPGRSNCDVIAFECEWIGDWSILNLLKIKSYLPTKWNCEKMEYFVFHGPSLCQQSHANGPTLCKLKKLYKWRFGVLHFKGVVR